MFRRRTFSLNGIHYRVSINKNMCPGPVDIYIDNNIYQYGFNSSKCNHNMIIRNSYPLSRHVTGSKGMGSLRPSGPAPSYHRLPFFFGFSGIVFDRISKIHIFGTKL